MSWPFNAHILWCYSTCLCAHRFIFILVHLIGEHGSKTKTIGANTNCKIHLKEYSNIDRTPMVITIVSNALSWAGVGMAKEMVVESLLEFLGDANSQKRLIYELATTAHGTFDIRREGRAVTTRVKGFTHQVWMQLLELPSAEFNGKLNPHGGYLTGQFIQQELTHGTKDCWIEVYGGTPPSFPSLCGPYVVVCGFSPHDVNRVAGRVADRIGQHMRECTYNCHLT